MVIEPDDNAIEIAAIMAGSRSPLVAVVDGKGDKAPMIGAVTVASLLSELLPERITDPKLRSSSCVSSAHSRRVDPVALTQYQAGDHGGDERADDHADLDVLGCR